MKWTGIAGLIVYWIFTLISIRLNSWFDLSKHTYSKLGVPGLARSPHVFWAGLIIGGVLIAFYGLWMIRIGSKAQAVGGGYVVLSGIFMILIAPIHAGLKAHDTLALLTFLTFYSGSTIFGIWSESSVLKISQPAVFAIALFFLLSGVLPSLGYLELVAISLVMLDTILVPLFCRRSSKPTKYLIYSTK